MQKKYTALIDVDTLIFHAALAGQETSVVVTHKNTGWQKTFKNKTEFHGHYIKREGGWLAEINKGKIEKGVDPVSPDDFTIEPVTTLIPSEYTDDGRIITAEAVVKGRFKSKIEAIQNQPWCKDIKICFGTGENFRYDIAQTTPYKEARPTKPLLHTNVKEYMLKKYKDKLIIHDGVETDDIVTSLMHEAWVRSGKDHDKLDVVATYIDKDLSQYPCIHYNFDKPENGLETITQVQATKNLAIQCLKGDVIDSIPGLPDLPIEMFTKYGIRKPTKPGIGDKTASALIDSVESESEVFRRVVEAYKGYYGVEYKPFASFRGEKSKRTWLGHLNEQWRLLRMRSVVDKDVGHVGAYLDELGVEY